MSRIRCTLHPRGRRRRAVGDDGFTMTETVVSITLLAIVAVGATTAITTGTHAQASGQDRTVAVNLAHADLEQARALTYPDYPASVANHTVTVGDQPYTVGRTVTPLYASQAVAPAGQTCPAQLTATGVLSLRVTTTVSWRDGKGQTQSTAMTTVVAC